MRQAANDSPFPLRVLILEDNALDADLVVAELRRSGFVPESKCVETQSEYVAALASRAPDLPFDVILADYSLPQFDGLQALRLLKEQGLDIPFIIVTGALGDEKAAECIRAGAADYLLKDHLARLGPAVRRALREKEERGRLAAAEAALHARRITELERAVKELDAFSYSISHDLRSPLRAIDGFSRILIEDYQAALPAPAREHLDRVRQSAQHMSKLIDDLLAFSRLSRQPLRLQPVNPAPLVRRVLDDLHEDQRGRNVKITIQDLPACRGDAAMLQQVFHNLLANALKFTRPRDPAIIEIGSVPQAESTELKAQTSGSSGGQPSASNSSGGQVTYFVRDNGVGFDDQYADRAFGVFQRLHRAEEYEGTGVGLAIVQRIVHRHGGQVWAKAQVDKGATFYFTLPADVESNPA